MNERGESFVNIYSNDGAELLVQGGKPFNEIVFTYEPSVTNTEEQINKCISDYNSEKLGDPNQVNSATTKK